jgi:hypothetical protein
MNKFLIGTMLIIFLLAGSAFTAQAEGMNSPPGTEGRMKPPPEAIAACKGKSEGTTVKFTTPRGDTLKGVCKEFEGVLAAMPERGAPPLGGGGKHDEAGTDRQTD